MPSSIEVPELSPELATPDTVSILHWNVWHRSEPGEIIDVIAAANPDIVCLHELAADSSYFQGENVAERVRDELGLDGIYEEAHSLRSRKGDTFVRDGAAVLSELPVVTSSTTTLSETGWDAKYQGEDYRRIYVEAAIDIGGEILTVGTVHLSLLQAELGNRGVRRLETDRLTEIARQKQERFILTGDFNTGGYGQSVRAMSDVLRRLDGVLAVPTFGRSIELAGRQLGVSKRLDYVFVTPDNEVVGARVLDRGPSDHNPLYIALGKTSLSE
jgi:endonuclease/exonuclease/phosphatase family metal-dependent hydrolase